MKRWISCCLIIVPFIASAQWTIQSVTQVTAQPKQYEKVVYDISVTGPFTNPYDDSDISLDLVLTTASSKTLRYPCFFVSGDGTSSQWQARITPRENGDYTGLVELRKTGVLKSTLAISVATVEPTAKDGFLKKKDNWSFQFDSGKSFRGIGENVAWEGRSWEPDNYNYEYFLTKLANNGMNYFRTWSSAWNLPLEWKTVVDTKRYSNSSAYFHQQGAQRLDELVDLCEKKNIFMMLTLGWHGELQTGDRWNINVYNSANGGPATTPTEFFTSTAAIKQYKNRLRYVIARWGYSPSIGAIEFFNEIDNAVYNGTESTIAIPHNAVTQWHDQVSSYLKSIDPYGHLLTTSVSHREITGLFNVSNLDFVQKHIYKATATIPSVIGDLESRYSKPFVAGEFGYDWDWNNITDGNGSNLDFDFKRGLWYGLFSPTPVTPMSWWWEFFELRGTSDYFKSIAMIADRMQIAGQSCSSVNISSQSAGLESYAVKSGSTYFVYALNNSSTAMNGNVASLSNMSNGVYHVESFDPDAKVFLKQPDILGSNSSLAIPVTLASKASGVFIIAPDGIDIDKQSSFNASPAELPGIIEAEDYDKGGEGIAFHDFDATNTGGQYRTAEGVDIEACVDGGYNITSSVTGEWTEYTVDVKKSGIYQVDVKNSSDRNGKSLQLTLDGHQISIPVVLQSAGGGQSWSMKSVQTILIEKGIHILRMTFGDASINVDKVEFKLVNQAPDVVITNPKDDDEIQTPATTSITVDAVDNDGSIVSVEYFANGNKIGESTESPFTIDWKPTAGYYTLYASATDDMGLAMQSSSININILQSTIQLPYPDSSTPHAIPGKIEAEDVDAGAEGIAYHDLTPTNIKGLYRSDVDFDIEQCADVGGGFNLADIQATEWVEYAIEVAKAAKYDFTFRVATQMDGQSFSVLINDKTIISSVSVPNTGAWQAWKYVTVKGVSLNEGSAVLSLLFNSEFFNLNYFNVTESSVVTDVDHSESQEVIMYPNPSNGEINLILPPSAKEIQIVSLEGHLVYRQEVQQSHTLISNTFAAGMYLVVIKHNSGHTEYKKALIRPSSH